MPSSIISKKLFSINKSRLFIVLRNFPGWFPICLLKWVWTLFCPQATELREIMKTFGWECALTADDKQAKKEGSDELLISTHKSYTKAAAGAEDCVKKSKLVWAKMDEMRAKLPTKAHKDMEELKGAIQVVQKHTVKINEATTHPYIYTCIHMLYK